MVEKNLTYKVLILTDHSNHTAENSLYDLVAKMLVHKNTEKIDIASRANKRNQSFFNSETGADLFVHKVKNGFVFDAVENPLSTHLTKCNLSAYNLIWLRMPPPMRKNFLEFVEQVFKDAFIINSPKGIYETGSKAYLMNFQSVCPPMKICYSLEDIIEFKNQFPIVLKPFREYGGRGIIKIDKEMVSMGGKTLSFNDFIKAHLTKKIEYIAVKFLKNVGLGDKRIVVVNGEILGGSLRLPPKGSWICNVSMGGTSNITDVDEAEKQIIELINPPLAKLGIAMYGVDTLVGDDGKRVLSEINTTSIGGLPQIAAMQNKPIVEKAIDLIWAYYKAHKNVEA